MQPATDSGSISFAQPSRWTAFSALLVPALWAHAPLLLIVLFQIAFIAALVLTTPDLSGPSVYQLLSVFVFLGGIVPLSILTLRFYHIAMYERPKHPVPALLRDSWRFVRDPARAANGIVMSAIFLVFINLFAIIKDAIPIIQPFSWDVTLMEWDRWLHFGHDPWRLLHPVLGYPLVTFLITVNYHLWFMVMWITLTGFAFARMPSVLRTRFFLSFMLSWFVGGSLMAIGLSSAGPCYYGLIGLTPDPYAPLMAYLHRVNETLPLWAIDTQLLLWQGYMGEGPRLGISAMPSMHNATALLVALTAWQINRKLGWALSVFAALIFLGSIHLGWHYALDGYIGFAIALLAWWAAGKLARRWEGSARARDYTAEFDRVNATANARHAETVQLH